jgi:microcystin-dependent protein
LSVTFVDGTVPLNAANLNTLESKPQKGQPNGYAALDATGKVPAAQLPAAGGSVPTGTGFDWFGGAAPAGYLLCDGSAVSRATYAALFGVVGTQYGAGDGSTTFNLPDCRGRATVGLGTHADVATLGQSEGSAVANRRPKHPHTLSGAPGVGSLAIPNHAHAINDPSHVHQAQNWEFGTAGGSTSFQVVQTASGALNVTANVIASQTGITVGNPTSLPAVTGVPSVGTLAVGVAGTAADSSPYLVANKIIKT